MAVGSTQPLIGIFPGGKGGRYIGLTTLPPSCADLLKSGSLNLLEPPGPVQACNGIALRPETNLVAGIITFTMAAKQTWQHIFGAC